MLLACNSNRFGIFYAAIFFDIYFCVLCLSFLRCFLLHAYAHQLTSGSIFPDCICLRRFYLRPSYWPNAVVCSAFAAHAYVLFARLSGLHIHVALCISSCSISFLLAAKCHTKRSCSNPLLSIFLNLVPIDPLPNNHARHISSCSFVWYVCDLETARADPLLGNCLCLGLILRLV